LPPACDAPSTSASPATAAPSPTARFSFAGPAAAGPKTIALKCLLPEADSEQALAAIDRHALQAPEWLAAECAEVLAHRLRRGEIDRETAAAALDDLRLLPISWVADRQLVAPAFEIAVEIDRPIQDCLYLALAIERNLQLLTADRRLLRALEHNPQLFVRVDLLDELGS
jgi:predicted nucleic acid-binding protein